MKRIVLYTAMALGLACQSAFAVAPTYPATPPFSILGGQTSLAVTTTSAQVALPASLAPFSAVTIQNLGTVDAFFALSDGTVAATGSGTCTFISSIGPSCKIPAGMSITVWSGTNSFVAAITASGSTNLLIYQATGPIQARAFGGSGNSGVTSFNSRTGAVSPQAGDAFHPDGDASSVAFGASALAAQTNSSTGNNSAFGVSAGSGVTSGINETFFGNNAGVNVTTGSQEMAIGVNALGGGSGAALTGNYNTAIGQGAFRSLTGTATENIAIGAVSGEYVTTGTDNNALGDDTLGAFGAVALTGSGNDVFGWGAGSFLQGAEAGNSLFGDQAGRWLTASSNVAIGQLALSGSNTNNETGNNDSVMGTQAGRFVSSGAEETACGAFAMTGISGTPLTGNFNTACGYQAGTNLQGAANADVLFGAEAGKTLTTGSSDVIIGPFVATTTLTTGNSDILIGVGSNCDTAAGSTSSQLLICAATGSTPLLTGNLASASLALALGSATVEGAGTFNIPGAYYDNNNAGVSCAANSVSLLTEVVTGGIVTHC